MRNTFCRVLQCPQLQGMVVPQHLETTHRWASSLVEGLRNWALYAQRMQCLGSHWWNDIVLTIIHVNNALFVVPQKAWLKRSRLLLWKSGNVEILGNHANSSEWTYIEKVTAYILTSGITSTKYLSATEWSTLSLLVHPFLRDTTQRRTMPPLNLKCERAFKWSLARYFT